VRWTSGHTPKILRFDRVLALWRQDFETLNETGDKEKDFLPGKIFSDAGTTT